VARACSPWIIGGMPMPRRNAGTSSDLVNWVGARSGPEMLLPYAAGAARSRLLFRLTEGHYGARLTPEGIETLACWIDLQMSF
jgi:hypothetical protein